MKFDPSRVLTVARREFLTTIRRKAFLFTVVGTPAYFAFVRWVTTSSELRERSAVLRELSVVGVVDSSGLFAGATREIRTELELDDVPFPRSGASAAAARAAASRAAQQFQTEVRFFPDQETGERAVRDKQISQLVVIPSDYLEHGGIRRYARTSSLLSSEDRRAVTDWLARNLVKDRVDSLVAARVARPAQREQRFTLNRGDEFVLKNDARETVDLMLPIMFTLLLGLSITLGGQYLLQGVAEEKESRILESMLCIVSPDELLAGKMVGLGGAGLLVVSLWALVAATFAAPTLTMLQVQLPAATLLLMVAYFVLGYLFFASLMTGIAAITNNMREAQQFSVWFAFANFAPLILFTSIVGRPNGRLAAGLSMFPPTASTTMMMRLTSPAAAVPAWQIALSLALLGGAAAVTLLGAARVFRIGMLLYGKSPNLPEILRWARQRA
jgi:ABC-2 type transport system permease protein